jgi:hypothetical protein
MYTAQRLLRKLDTRCLPCFAQHRERASVAPHEMLQLVASVEKPTGTREEFICGTCGQTMVRFVAKQTNPPPSDVWRNEKASTAPSAPPVADPPAEKFDQRALEAEREDETFDSDASSSDVSDEMEVLPEDDPFDSHTPPSAVSYENAADYDHTPHMSDEAPSHP